MTVRNGVTLGATLLVTWSVALIVRLQVPAHLGPTRAGQFAFAESFAAVFFTLIGLGIDTHLMREVAVRPRHASEIVGGVFALRALLGAALLGGLTATLWLTGRPAEIVLTAAVFGVANLILANNATLVTVLLAASGSGAVATANVVAKILWATGVMIGLRHGAPLALLALALPAADLAKTMILVPATRRVLDLRFRIDVSALRRGLRASAPFLANAVALGMLGNVGLSVLGFIRQDEREVGWFSAVQNLGVLCFLLIPLIGWVIMPALARAYARSEAEGLAVLRRALGALVLAIVPLTVVVAAGSGILVRIAFGDAFAPAATGLTILSLVFVMTYVNTTLATALIVVGRGWSVTFVSASSIVVNAALVVVFVPIGRHLVGTGGECAGAAASVVATDAVVLILMLSRFPASPLDTRTTRLIVTCVILGAWVLLIDRAMAGLGPARLVVDGLLYGALVFALRMVRVSDIRRALSLLRLRSGAPVGPEA